MYKQVPGTTLFTSIANECMWSLFVILALPVAILYGLMKLSK